MLQCQPSIIPSQITPPFHIRQIHMSRNAGIHKQTHHRIEGDTHRQTKHGNKAVRAVLPQVAKGNFKQMFNHITKILKFIHIHIKNFFFILFSHTIDIFLFFLHWEDVRKISMAIEKNHPIIYNILQKSCQNVNSLKMSEKTFLVVPQKCAIPHTFVRNRTMRTLVLLDFI